MHDCKYPHLVDFKHLGALGIQALSRSGTTEVWKPALARRLCGARPARWPQAGASPPPGNCARIDRRRARPHTGKGDLDNFCLQVERRAGVQLFATTT